MSKLIISKVEFGKIPFGAGAGTSSIAVHFGVADGEYDYPAPKPNPKKPDYVYTPDEIAGHGLMGDLLKIIDAQGLGEEWTKVLVIQNYIYFVGECMAAPEHRAVASEFLNAFDACALAVQVELIKQREPDPEKQKAIIANNGIQPALSFYVSAPKYFTGASEWYEHFRFLMVKYPLDETSINPMALVEMGRHRFAVGILDIKDIEKDTKTIADKYESLDALTIPGDRTFVVDHEGSDKVVEYAISKGYRINVALPYSKKYVLDL